MGRRDSPALQVDVGCVCLRDMHAIEGVVAAMVERATGGCACALGSAHKRQFCQVRSAPKHSPLCASRHHTAMADVDGEGEGEGDGECEGEDEGKDELHEGGRRWHRQGRILIGARWGQWQSVWWRTPTSSALRQSAATGLLGEGLILTGAAEASGRESVRKTASEADLEITNRERRGGSSVRRWGTSR